MAVLERPVAVAAADRGTLFSAEAGRAGLLGGAVAAGVMLIVVAGSGHEALFRSDADLFRRVATDPFGDGSTIAAPEIYGTSYRYGRILFPLLAWLLAFGQAGWVEWTLPAVGVVGFGLLVAAATELLLRRGQSSKRVLVLAAVPALWLSMAIAFSEPLVIGLTLTALLWWEQRRRRPALALAAAALLAREVMALAFVPVVLGALRRRAWREVAAWCATGGPLLAWWVWVWARVGELPFRDPSLSRREAMAVPFTGMRRLLETGEARADMWCVFALGLVTAAAAVAVWRRGPRTTLAGAALALGLLMTALGPNALRSPGEAIRVMAPAQVFVVLAAVTSVAARSTRRETLDG
jgi:hypothetical protein